MLVQEPIQGAIWHCLQNYAYPDATFLAERLLAEVGTDDALHLLATAYYQSGKPGRAYSVMLNHGHNTPQLKYLMAKCCFDLGKLDEAETVLVGPGFIRPKHLFQDIQVEFGPLACFVFQLLGIIYSKSDRMSRSVEALRRSLKINPFLWHSYATLCDNGDKPDPSKVFKLDGLENFSNINGGIIGSLITHTETTTNPVSETVNSTTTANNTSIKSSNEIIPMQTGVISTPLPNSAAALNTPFSFSVSSIQDTIENSEVGNKTKKFVRFKHISPITPHFGTLPFDLCYNSGDSDSSCLSNFALLSPSPLSVSHTHSQSNKMQHLNVGKRILCRSGKESPVVMNKPTTVFAPTGNNSNFQSPPIAQGYVRRSSRLFGNSSSVKENNKNRFVAPKSPARKTKTRSSKSQSSLTELNEKNKIESQEILPLEKSINDKNVISQSLSQQAVAMQKQSADGLMSLLKDIGLAYLELSQYNCKKSIDLFSHLPSQHYHTSWVLSHLAKAYFEVNDYTNAIKLFSEVKDKEPHCLHLMEYLSTAYWHQQSEVKLSALAQDLIEINNESPQAWCATGNCFSLQKEHETAIRFFSRAVQVDTNFAYAYSLLGHEHLATEELDRALSCYRSAVRIDPRHYNAWYGIGLVMFKQERYLNAAWHFRKAASIHPECAVLLCHIAVAEHTMQRSLVALNILDRALIIDSLSPLCKFHRASILVSLERYQEALEELQSLKQLIPKESNVYFLLGKVYKKLGDSHLALMNYSWAMDLDPKGANGQFKESLDPANNCNSIEEDDNANNPQENARSEMSASVTGLESSQESLILEHSADFAQISGIEEHQLSSSISTPSQQPNDIGPLRGNDSVTGSSRNDPSYSSVSFLNRPNTRTRFN